MVELFESTTLPAPAVSYQINPHAESHARLARLGASILAAGCTGEVQLAEFPLRHHFSPGVYGREMLLPAGHVIVGKIHKHENMLVMLQGECELFDGFQRHHIQAPQVWVTPAGSQRAAFAFTDCIFLSVIGTHETDIQKIEEEMAVTTPQQYEQFLLTCKQQED